MNLKKRKKTGKRRKKVEAVVLERDVEHDDNEDDEMDMDEDIDRPDQKAAEVSAF